MNRDVEGPMVWMIITHFVCMVGINTKHFSEMIRFEEREENYF